VIPMLAPVAEKMGIDLIWFGVIIAMNLQTSFLTPPFGFALFYLRSVASRTDYTDRVTNQRIPAVTTAQIYKGSIAFIILQLMMVAAVIMYPGLVSSGLAKEKGLGADEILERLRAPDPAQEAAPPPSIDPAASQPEPGSPSENNDDMNAILEALKKEQGKK
jgi:hypothetical protein